MRAAFVRLYRIVLAISFPMPTTVVRSCDSRRPIQKQIRQSFDPLTDSSHDKKEPCYDIRKVSKSQYEWQSPRSASFYTDTADDAWHCRRTINRQRHRRSDSGDHISRCLARAVVSAPEPRRKNTSGACANNVASRLQQSAASVTYYVLFWLNTFHLCARSDYV